MSNELRFKQTCITEYEIFNDKSERLGTIERMRIGRFMHWCFIPEIQDEYDYYSRLYFTNGCLKQITEFITKLYKK